MAYDGGVKVVWDDNKNAQNRKKHGLSFEEAALLLLDEEARLDIFDEEHSSHEPRFISIGPIQRGLVLVVWTEREGEVVRIISARWATRHEQELYQSYWENSR